MKLLIPRKNLRLRENPRKQQVNLLRASNGKLRPKPMKSPSKRLPPRRSLRPFSPMTTSLRPRQKPPSLLKRLPILLTHNNNNLLTPWLGSPE